MPRRRTLSRVSGLIWPLLVALAAPPAGAEAVLVGRYVWDDPEVGGISGLELEDDGIRFLAVSDVGQFYVGLFQRDAEGAVTGVSGAGLPMLDLRGQTVTQGEALAISEAGLWVGLEGLPRLWLYEKLDRPPISSVPLPREINAYPPNSALEALAVASDGTLYVILETPTLDGVFPVFRYRDARWDIAFEIPLEGGLRPTGADIGPDGHIYMVERAVTPLGFVTQVRRFSPDGLMQQRVLRHDPGAHDNLEAISVWLDDAGRIRLTLISDDNLEAAQVTEILDYRLDG